MNFKVQNAEDPTVDFADKYRPCKKQGKSYYLVRLTNAYNFWFLEPTASSSVDTQLSLAFIRVINRKI